MSGSKFTVVTGHAATRRKLLVAGVVATVLAAIVVWFRSAATVADASPAQAVVNFDGFPDDTPITDQYANVAGPGNGVVFGVRPGRPATVLQSPRITTTGSALAQSGTQVGNIRGESGSYTFGTFSKPHKSISVFVGQIGNPGKKCSPGQPPELYCADMTLTAYASNGAPVGQPDTATVSAGYGFHTKLSVTTTSANIVGFEVGGRPEDEGKELGIDDLTFDLPQEPPPTGTTATTATTPKTGTTTQRTKSTTTTTTATTTPPPPGVRTLTLDRPLGPPRSVPIAHGSGFDPGPITLRWNPGLGSVDVNVPPSGIFDAAILVLPHDTLGPRRLVAKRAGVEEASTEFLVVPAAVDPTRFGVRDFRRRG
jgi:hypothetical protein